MRCTDSCIWPKAATVRCLLALRRSSCYDELTTSLVAVSRPAAHNRTPSRIAPFLFVSACHCCIGSNDRGARVCVSCIRRRNSFFLCHRKLLAPPPGSPNSPWRPWCSAALPRPVFRAVANSNRDYPGGAGRLRYPRPGTDRNRQNRRVRTADYRAVALRATTRSARSHPCSHSGTCHADPQRFRKASQVHSP